MKLNLTKILFFLIFMPFLLLSRDFFSALGLPLDLLLTLVLFLHLQKKSFAWPATLWAGIILDLSYGSGGLFLVSLTVIAFLINRFTFAFSASNYFATVILVSVGVYGYLILTFIFSRLPLLGPAYLFSLSFVDSFYFLLFNSLAILFCLHFYRSLNKSKYVEIS